MALIYELTSHSYVEGSCNCYAECRSERLHRITRKLSVHQGFIQDSYSPIKSLTKSDDDNENDSTSYFETRWRI